MSEKRDETEQIPAGTLRGDVIKIHSFRVRCESGPDAGREWTLERARGSIGSGADADVSLSDRTVSRQHVVIERGPRGWTVSDAGSRNGTLLDGVPIQSGFLRAGSRIRIGQSELAFVPREENVVAPPAQERELYGVLGASAVMKRIFGVLRRVAAMNATVVLTGPTGAGKGALARAIHQASPRRAGPFAVLDCGNLDAELVRAELFGHTKGAFTGAAEARPGVFEVASGGTLFVDEIGELPLELQPKLLRVLDERRVTRLGSHQAVPVDVRLVAATHRDLRRMVAAGTFREDLLYRLAVVEVEVPPLKNRLEDLELIAERMLAEMGAKGRWPLAPAVMAALRAHDWPGNVRELRNVLERAVALAGDEPIRPELVAVPSRGAADAAGGGDEDALLDGSLADSEKVLIERVLARHAQNRTHAAAELGIAITTLRRKMKKYGLE